VVTRNARVGRVGRTAGHIATGNAGQLARLAARPQPRITLPHPDGVAVDYAKALGRVADQSFACFKPLIAALYRWQAMADAVHARADAKKPFEVHFPGEPPPEHKIPAAPEGITKREHGPLAMPPGMRGKAKPERLLDLPKSATHPTPAQETDKPFEVHFPGEPPPEYTIPIPPPGAAKPLTAEQERAAEQNKPHSPSEKGARALPLPMEIETEIVAASHRLTILREGLPTKGIAGRAADMLVKWSTTVNTRVLEDLGLNPVKPGTALAQARDAWVKDNAALITSQPREIADRVEAHIREMVPQGARWETIAKKLEEEHGIATGRARLIARDQVSKYNADMNRIRQVDAGITHYVWMGAMDNRERPAHVALEGTVWSWDSPPPIGNPGEPIMFRCSAIPCVSNQEKAKAAPMTEQDLIDRTAALGPTQRQGEGATPAEVRERAAKEVATEIRLANRRSTVAAAPKATANMLE